MTRLSSIVFGALLSVAALTLAAQHASASSLAKPAIVNCPECGGPIHCPPNDPNCDTDPSQP